MLPAATYRHIAREVHDLLMKPIDGIVLRPNEGNLSTLEADMQGPDGTPFEDGSFVLRLVFEKEYPSIPPKGFFLTRIFHPNISERGDICVNTLSKDWEKDLGLRHILLVIRCLLIDPNAESALNEEAAKLLLDDYHEYARRAKVMTGIHAVKRNVFPDAANSTSPNGHGFSHAHVVALRPSKLSNQDASDMGTVDSDGDGRKSTGGGVNPLSSSQGTAEVQRSVYATRDKRRALKRL